MKRITAEDIVTALMAARVYTDIYQPARAKLYRDLEKLGMVHIVTSIRDEKAKPKPIFGSTITPIGQMVLAHYKGWTEGQPRPTRLEDIPGFKGVRIHGGNAPAGTREGISEYTGRRQRARNQSSGFT